MTRLKILICGAGIAGNALAFWLAKLNHDVTVVERWPTLRTSGLQLDLRGKGIEIMKRMGLETPLRAKCIHETGMEVLDTAGRSWAFFPANTTGTGRQSFSSEYEFLRGDFCQILYDETKDRAKFVFGTWVESFRDSVEGVDVRFSDDTSDRFHLVVGADGQRSRTRRMLLGPDVDAKSIDFLGDCIAYFTIPRAAQPGEEYRARGFYTVGGRFLMLRRHNNHQMQVYLGCDAHRPELKGVKKGDTEAEKEAFIKIFRGAGWETDAVLKALAEDTDDFYCEHIGIVRLDSWSSGHVVLIGDASHCPTPRTGSGVTSSLVGAYILAGEIETHCGQSGTKECLPAALKSYDEKLRPFIAHLTRGISSEKGWLTRAFNMVTSTHTGIWFLYWIVAIVALLRLDSFLGGAWREDIKGWSLPDYGNLMHSKMEQR